MNIAFTVAVLYIFYMVNSEPYVLIGAFFAFTTGELWLLANIKNNKIRQCEKECEGGVKYEEK